MLVTTDAVVTLGMVDGLDPDAGGPGLCRAGCRVELHGTEAKGAAPGSVRYVTVTVPLDTDDEVDAIRALGRRGPHRDV